MTTHVGTEKPRSTCDNRLVQRRSGAGEQIVSSLGGPRVKITQPVPPEAISAEMADFDVDALIEPALLDALAALDGRAPLLSGMVRYHLGYAGHDLRPLDSRVVDRGKRMRPAVALLAADAAGGDPRDAAPVAAAVELLHNFTLIHDDIQDESPIRRHRPTVWSLWGVGQAINAGDALFAAAHLPLYRIVATDITPELSLRLVEAFDRMTIAIVEGQTLDLAFEARPDVSPGEYLEMIAGKTAAIVRFAAWAGALLGGADDATASRWAEFGLALGLGFQVRDDLLGIWGAQEATGKASADDVRRRKQSLPILILRERLDNAEREELNRLFTAPNVDGVGVARVLALLEREAVRQEVEAVIAGYHDRAAAALTDAAQPGTNSARVSLLALVERLSSRSS
jgi:geranylgeranyl diphosphate synthase type I